MSDPVATQLPAPEQQAQPAPYPLAGSLTAGVEYTFTSAAGYAFTAVYNKLNPRRLPAASENQGRHRRVRQPDGDRRRRSRRRLAPGRSRPRRSGRFSAELLIHLPL